MKKSEQYYLTKAVGGKNFKILKNYKLYILLGSVGTLAVTLPVKVILKNTEEHRWSPYDDPEFDSSVKLRQRLRKLRRPVWLALSCLGCPPAEGRIQISGSNSAYVGPMKGENDGVSTLEHELAFGIIICFW